MEGGIEPERVGELTFRQIDWLFERQRKLTEDNWDYTRCIMGAVLGKKPKDIVKLSRDPGPKKWTQEKAKKVIERFGVRWQR